MIKGEAIQPIIVLGMHRSGSSLLVRILQELGVFMGNDLEENNESMFFNKINDWMLLQAGASWDNPENFNYISNDFKGLMAEITENRLNSIHLKRYMGSSKRSIKNAQFTWGWKDPRNTFTIDVWKAIFPEARIIHIYRNPVDVVNSLIKRETSIISVTGNPTKTGLKKKFYGLNLPRERLFYHSFKSLDKQAVFSMWKQYVEKALRLKEEKDILSISYENLLENPEIEMGRIAGFCGMKTKSKADGNFLESFDKTRKYAFTYENELMEFYETIKDDGLVLELGYGSIGIVKKNKNTTK